MAYTLDELERFDESRAKLHDRLERSKSEVKAQELAYKRMLAQLPTMKKKAESDYLLGRSSLINARVGASRHAMEFKEFWKPTLVFILVIFLLMGAGSAAIMQIFYSLNIWAWVAIVFGAILIWRNWKR